MYKRQVLYLLIGAGGISIAMSGRFQQGWLTLVRMMFLLPCYQWGTLYRQKREEKDRADVYKRQVCGGMEKVGRAHGEGAKISDIITLVKECM